MPNLLSHLWENSTHILLNAYSSYLKRALPVCFVRRMQKFLIKQSNEQVYQ